MNRIKILPAIEVIHRISANGFFDGWLNKPSDAKFIDLLKSSFISLVAFDRETDQIVGFVTAISDGVLASYIPFLDVKVEYRVQGIVSFLLTEVINKLSDHYMVDLTCDPQLVSFYNKFEMREMTAMTLRNYAVQSGRKTT